MGGLGRRLADTVLVPISNHPLRAAGAVGALIAAAVTWVNITASTSAGTASRTGSAGTVTLDTAISFAMAHPAYPVAIVLGLAIAAFAR